MSLAFYIVLSVSAGFLVLLETIKRNFKIETLYTRKAAHIFFFFVILASYYNLSQSEAVAILSIFLAVFSFSYAKYILSAIHIKKYKTIGEILYILAFIALFFFFSKNQFVFVASAAVLGIIDPISAFFKGPSKRRLSYNAIYFAMCLALFFTLMIYFGTNNIPKLILAAFVAAIADRYSEYGFDNLTVPISTALILA